MAQLVGRVRIALDGQIYNSKPGAKLDPGGVTNEPVVGDAGVDRAEKLRPAKIECEFHWRKGLSLTALNDVTDATIQFITDVGSTYVLNNGFRTGDLMATSGESGGIPMTFQGESVSEIGGA